MRERPVHGLTPSTFATLLRQLADWDLITQMKSGELVHGAKGEKLVNSFDFHTAFATPEEYRLVASGAPLGTLPVVLPITEGSFLIFAGRRWRVIEVDAERRVIDLVPAGDGRVPVFNSGPRGVVHDRVRREMFAVYTANHVPTYLDTQRPICCTRAAKTSRGSDWTERISSTAATARSTSPDVATSRSAR